MGHTCIIANGVTKHHGCAKELKISTLTVLQHPSKTPSKLPLHHPICLPPRSFLNQPKILPNRQPKSPNRLLNLLKRRRRICHTEEHSVMRHIPLSIEPAPTQDQRTMLNALQKQLFFNLFHLLSRSKR